MTPSNLSPDTGAGTPPEWPHRVDGDYLSVAVCEKCGEQWPCDSQRVLDAVRSRPATDPAGLDVERLARAIETLAHGHCCWDAATDAPDLAAEYARLSVADGPGPEERLRDEVVAALLDLDKFATWSALNRPEYPRLRAALDAYKAALPVEETGRS